MDGLHRIGLTALMVAAVLGARVASDSVGPPKRTVKYSRSERYSLTMTPGSATSQGGGVAQEAASGEILWKVDWFANEVELADDGKHLVRFGPWASDTRGLSDLAIAFYANGQELKRYQVRDLLKDRSKLSPSVSHYEWRRSDPNAGFSKDGRTFSITLVDGGAYVFHVATGRVASYRRSSP
jgi:hypothetical protein